MNSLAEELAEYLRYRKECGDKTVELEPGTLEALAALSGAPKAVVSPAPAATPADSIDTTSFFIIVPPLV